MADLIYRKELRDALYEADAITMQGVKIINQFPAVDAVEVDVIRKWLYEIAMNNVGIDFSGDFSDACEKIISRLEGLKKFSEDKDNG